MNDWDYWYSMGDYTMSSANGKITFGPNATTTNGCVTYDLNTGGYTQGGQITTFPKITISPTTKITLPATKLEASMLDGVKTIIKDLDEEIDRMDRDWDRSFIERTLRDMKADAFDQIKVLLKPPAETVEDDF